MCDFINHSSNNNNDEAGSTTSNTTNKTSEQQTISKTLECCQCGLMFDVCISVSAKNSQTTNGIIATTSSQHNRQQHVKRSRKSCPPRKLTRHQFESEPAIMRRPNTAAVFTPSAPTQPQIFEKCLHTLDLTTILEANKFSGCCRSLFSNNLYNQQQQHHTFSLVNLLRPPPPPANSEHASPSPSQQSISQDIVLDNHVINETLNRVLHNLSASGTLPFALPQPPAGAVLPQPAAASTPTPPIRPTDERIFKPLHQHQPPAPTKPPQPQPVVESSTAAAVAPTNQSSHHSSTTHNHDSNESRGENRNKRYTKFGLLKLSEANVETMIDGKKRFKCPGCSNVYANRSGLNRHYVTHSQNDEWKSKCSICAKKYSRKDSLKHHIKTQHNMTSKEASDAIAQINETMTSTEARSKRLRLETNGAQSEEDDKEDHGSTTEQGSSALSSELSKTKHDPRPMC